MGTIHITKTLISPLFLILILLVTASILYTVQPVHPSSPINVTVFTDKESYQLGKTVNIFGNLTQNGSLIQGLVVIEARNSYGELYVIRTLKTGSNPTVYRAIDIIGLTPCDVSGNPVSGFYRNTVAYFNVTVRNVGEDPVTVGLITVNVFDATMNPIGYAYFGNLLVVGATTMSIVIPFYVIDKAYTGTATAYANAYTDWPSLGGTAYGFEKNASFQITEPGGGGGGGQITTQTQTLTINSSPEGTYSLAFRLPSWAKGHTFTVYVNGKYQWEQAPTQNTTFNVLLPGDADGSGSVGAGDLGMLGIAWGSSVGDPNYIPECDFDESGSVGSGDLGIMGIWWGQSL